MYLVQIIKIFTVPPLVYIKIFSWDSWKYQMRKLLVYKKKKKSEESFTRSNVNETVATRSESTGEQCCSVYMSALVYAFSRGSK